MNTATEEWMFWALKKMRSEARHALKLLQSGVHANATRQLQAMCGENTDWNADLREINETLSRLERTQ